MKIKSLIVFTILFTISQWAFGQQYVSQVNSIGLSAGALAYSGRFSVGSSLGSHTSWYASAFYRRRVLNKTFVRVELLGGQMKADNRDVQSQAGKSTGMFQTGIVELTVKGEYDLLDLDMNRVTPFVVAGAGAYFLPAYSTTAPEKPESEKLGFVVPVGAGLKFKATDRIKIFAEGSYRFFTKNLDGHVGANLNNPNKYYSVGVGVIYELSPFNSLW